MTGTWTRRRLIVLAGAALSARGAVAAIAAAPPADMASPPSSPEASPGATPGATPLARGNGRASRQVSVSTDVTIRLTDEGFDPALVQSTNGHDLDIHLVNTGTRPHGFQITSLDIDVTLEPGERKTVVITRPPLGDFPYTSDAPGDEGMTGLLVFYI